MIPIPRLRDGRKRSRGVWKLRTSCTPTSSDAPRPRESAISGLLPLVPRGAVPAGTNGAVDVFVTNPADVILDINGYFAPAGTLPFYTVNPCRVMDTRAGEGKAGAFGPPTPAAGSVRNVPVPESGCGVPSGAQAYSLNITVVPKGSLGYLTIWPAGQPQPHVSTLNSFEGSVVANAAIVPAGLHGSVNVFVTDATDVIIDINGFFWAKP